MQIPSCPWVERLSHARRGWWGSAWSSASELQAWWEVGGGCYDTSAFDIIGEVLARLKRILTRGMLEEIVSC
jgi:hypothetical protein